MVHDRSCEHGLGKGSYSGEIISWTTTQGGEHKEKDGPHERSDLMKCTFITVYFHFHFLFFNFIFWFFFYLL